MMHEEGYLLARLGMSVEDAERIEEMCDDKGTAVKCLLRQFLCDLIDNDKSGGSDARMAISEWYRCSDFQTATNNG
ncbi:MAG: hypothetical protein J6A08_00165 [Lachnospiraceae bacterium]|nr:hypothetical protein [Lachnospiraceae bacterium]